MTTNITNLKKPDGNLNSSHQSVLDDSTREFQKIALAALLSIVIVIVILGNTLVILAVITTRRLRTVTNCFVMSLATADWFVGTFVMPPAVANALMGAWELGWILCDIWVSLDILLCTASILSLCAISVDRYLAVTQPLTYSRRRRSKRLALGMILIVWLSSALITCPPMFGWYEPGRHEDKTCRYNRNTGYVIFSAMGSFFIPMVVMLYVYMRISCVVAQRHDKLEPIDVHLKKSHVLKSSEESDAERGSEEGEELPSVPQSSQENFSYNDRIIKSFRGDYMPRRYKNNEKCTSPKGGSFQESTVSSTGSQSQSVQLDTGVVVQFESASRVSSFRKETKTAQTLSIVVGGFIACWLPFFMFYLLQPFMLSTDINASIMSYLTWLGWFNSGINPFIYAFYSSDFRLAFWRLTIKHFSKERRQIISPNE